MVGESPLRILLVEDNPGDARYIKELLTEATELSMRVVEDRVIANKPDGDEAAAPSLVHERRLEDGLDRLDEEPIDVVLLDLNLPDSHGIETLVAVRERTDLPIVVLTGVSDRGVGLTALGEGADEYLVKDEINADLLIRSVFHAIERRIHERELEQYHTIIETVSDGIYAIDDQSRFILVNSALASMTGYSREALLDAQPSLIGDPEAIESAETQTRQILAAEREQATIETELETKDGRQVPVETNFAPYPLGDDRYGRTGVIRDITERKAHERRHERQRRQLATLNALYELVNEISHLIIETTTREEIETLVCDSVVDSDSYAVAWIGDVDMDETTVSVRAMAGADATAEDIASGNRGPGWDAIDEAIRTGEVQVPSAVGGGATDDEAAEDSTIAAVEPREYPWIGGARTSAVIPITYEEMLYGVLCVSSDRADAFDTAERRVVGRLGEIVGHAINSIERKQALMSEDVIEIEFRASNVLPSLGVSGSPDGTISFHRAIPLTDGRFLEFGTVTREAVGTLRQLVESLPHLEEVTIFDEEAVESRFELTVTEPPVISTIAANGGQIHSMTIRDGDLTMVVHAPPSADVRQIVDAVQAEYPAADLAAQRRTTRSDQPFRRLESTFAEDLTDRQRAALEAAYFAGFFDWPREQSGEDVAASLGISASTFHQHVRIGQRKLLGALFG